MLLRRLLAIAVLASTSLALLPTRVATADGNCQFILGFQALHNLDPTDIGDSLTTRLSQPTVMPSSIQPRA